MAKARPIEGAGHLNSRRWIGGSGWNWAMPGGAKPDGPAKRHKFMGKNGAAGVN